MAAFCGGPKPRDVGTGVVCASFGRRGEWLSFGAAHPRHGFVELSAMPAFDERWRGRPHLVRHYRAAMTDDAHAFLAFEPAPISTIERGRAGSATLSQVCTFAPAAGRTVQVYVRGRLDRPALAEITEVEPPSPTGAQTAISGDGARLHVSASALPAEVTVEVGAATGGQIVESGWRIDAAGARLALNWPAGASERRLTISCTLTPAPAVTPNGSPSRTEPALERLAGPAWLVIPAGLRDSIEAVAERALRYVAECTALVTAPGPRVILADHRSLPLSWTRDAYWQARLLLGAGRADAVADHLRWLWLACDRPAAAWARSHHADGRRKDERFQADQQLYPLLELADYWLASGSPPQLPPAAPAWPELVAAVVGMVEARMSASGLLATDENAADDPAPLPYLLPTQILAGHAFARLAAVEPLGLAERAGALSTLAGQATAEHFRVNAPDGERWASAVDGTGASVFRHDANDLPTALAPLWGYCAADDPAWLRTIDYAFSPANPDYADGPFGGLGSAHTPGAWALGLIQEWLAYSLAGEPDRAAAALTRLVAAAMADGMLPEASDPATAAATARHWFAWPGAVVGAMLHPPPDGPPRTRNRLLGRSARA